MISGKKNPGLDFCKGIAFAFNVPVENVLRRAGLIPPVPQETATLSELRVSVNTVKSIWRYLAERPDAQPDDPLFLSTHGGALTTAGLLRVIKSIGGRANVKNAHPHRFRHTFAINFLRNGGNTLELQALLGHSTLEMVKRYVAIAQVDLAKAHRRASPVANWNL